MSRRAAPVRQVRRARATYRAQAASTADSAASAAPAAPPAAPPPASADRAHVLRNDRLAGVLERGAAGFRFTYDADYLRDALPPVSLTLPRRAQPYESPHLFACFAALLAEGALAAEQCRQLRTDERDLFGRLVGTAGGEVIGTLRVVPAP